jgi:ribosomal protein L11 methyltransferase
MEQPLFQLSVRVPVSAEEAVIAAMETVFDRPASSYTDHETQETRVSVYGPARESPKKPSLRKFSSTLAMLAEMQLLPSRPRISVRQLRAQDWAESWKRHFHPLDVLGRLLVKPSWSRRKPKPGQETMVLDPGLSFGTGQHPTTRYCLTQLVRLRLQADTPSFLDMGTGSGILAIAAAKLDYGQIDGFDFDPKAIEVAKENALMNGVEKRVAFRRSDLKKIPNQLNKRYFLVCANILADILIQEKSTIVSRLLPGGYLVLAGILRHQFTAIHSCFEQEGLKLIDRCADKEWESGTFWLREVAVAEQRTKRAAAGQKGAA